MHCIHHPNIHCTYSTTFFYSVPPRPGSAGCRVLCLSVVTCGPWITCTWGTGVPGCAPGTATVVGASVCEYRQTLRQCEIHVLEMCIHKLEACILLPFGHSPHSINK